MYEVSLNLLLHELIWPVVISNVNQILINEQKKSDFKLTDDQSNDGKEYTAVRSFWFFLPLTHAQACKKVLNYLDEHYNTVKSTLDGGNARNYLTQFGIALYQFVIPIC